MQKKLAIGFVKALAFIVLPLFLAAGTFAWPAGWIFVISFMAMTIAISLMLLHHDPALFNERLKGLYQEGQPWWDKLILSAVMFLWLAWLALIGLDAGRFHWSDVPLAVQVLGFAGVVAAFIALYVVSRTNSFLVPVVRLQSERGQRVISTGPYALVRHPMYAAALLLLFATPPMLGSWWGLLGALALAAVLVLRTSLEDRTLQRGLPGYADYARQVRYRLVPLLW
jgi:protein-S-isoprenylcysteine O-methyltransferase Ste14